MKYWILGLLAAWIPVAQAGFSDSDLLPVDEAFALEASVATTNRIVAKWTIADGYYLYRSKFRFSTDAEGIRFGEASYPARITLRLTVGSALDDIIEVSWPRGVYPLSRGGDNNLTVVLDGAKAGNFEVMDGSVLVTESTNQRIVGSAVVQRVWRPLAPLPVPERYDPPLVIRFMIKK